MPQYKLPSAEMAEPTVPKFIRDSYNIGDIEGTKPRPRHRFATVRLWKVGGGFSPQHTRFSLPPCLLWICCVSNSSATLPNAPLLVRSPQRENHTVLDIEGAQANWKPRHVRSPRAPPSTAMFDVQDINNVGLSPAGQLTHRPLCTG